jgi:flagellar motor switch protein FliG
MEDAAYPVWRPAQSLAPVAAPRVRGMQKAAVLLISLGPDHAAEVLRHLRDGEIEALTLEMAKLQNVASATTEAVLEELAATVRAYEALAAGGLDYARQVLERALGEDRAGELVDRLSRAIENRPFEFLRRTPPDQLATFLQHESRQTAALVIAYLPPAVAAQVLSEMPGALQADLGMRIAQMASPSIEIVRHVEDLMRQKLGSIQQHQAETSGGIDALAEILNHVDRPTESNVLDTIDEADQEVAVELRRLLFTFEDIVKLDDRAMQLVVREADPKDLALALRAAGDELKQRILGNMSQRGAQMLLEDIELQTPQRKRVIEEAQGRVVAIVRRLEDAGTIVIARGDEEFVV